MICKQVIFTDLEMEVQNIAGIAVYEDFGQGSECPFAELRGVICGVCGEWLEPERVEIDKTLDRWWGIDGAIEDNFFPDDTRGFRLEDQINMDFPDDVDETGYNPYIGGYDYDC